MSVPTKPKIYHIVHTDRLSSVIQEGGLLSDAGVIARSLPGTSIGMNSIKRRRLTLQLSSYPDLCVGSCVPFYFSPRSIMLYMFCKDNNPEITYHGGQSPIVHLEADLYNVIDYLNRNAIRWAFTTSNAGSNYFWDYANLNNLDKINWDAVLAINWESCKEEKQAEFLVENTFPWCLFERIGVHDQNVHRQVQNILTAADYRPGVEVHQEWYY